LLQAASPETFGYVNEQTYPLCVHLCVCEKGLSKIISYFTCKFRAEEVKKDECKKMYEEVKEKDKK
jgi:hypothetical protein